VNLVDIARDYTVNCRTRKKHVSIIMRGNEIASIACNAFEVPSRYAFMGYRSLHSEVAALMRWRGQKDGLRLYNFRFNNAGDLKLACPCKICLPWCESVFDSITYSTNEGRLVRLENYYDDSVR
jgi:hypothetical protein